MSSCRYNTLAPGQLVSGTRYRVVRFLGAGGMSQVYEVEHAGIERRFVLKLLRSDLVARRDLVQRVRNEWRVLARLRHPNIIAVTDAGLTRDRVPYFVMERLVGETLAKRLERRRCLPVPEALEIAHQLLSALGVCHSAGVIHRDVKPPNVYLPRAAPLKLLDFGIAKVQGVFHALTDTGVALGTPRYMSPEQAAGCPLDHRADLYSVGLLLFEMVAGRSVFPFVRDAEAALAAQLEEPPVALAEVVPGVARELSDLVAQLLAKRPDARPSSAEAVIARIEPLIHRYSSQVSTTAATKPQLVTTARLSVPPRVQTQATPTPAEPAPRLAARRRLLMGAAFSSGASPLWRLPVTSRLPPTVQPPPTAGGEGPRSAHATRRLAWATHTVEGIPWTVSGSGTASGAPPAPGVPLGVSRTHSPAQVLEELLHDRRSSWRDRHTHGPWVPLPQVPPRARASAGVGWDRKGYRQLFGVALVSLLTGVLSGAGGWVLGKALLPPRPTEPRASQAAQHEAWVRAQGADSAAAPSQPSTARRAAVTSRASVARAVSALRGTAASTAQPTLAPAPAPRAAPAPAARVTPAPAARVTPAPAARVTPAPAARVTPAPPARVTPAPPAAKPAAKPTRQATRSKPATRPNSPGQRAARPGASPGPAARFGRCPAPAAPAGGQSGR